VDRTRLSIAPGPLMAPVLARLIGIHVARADLPVDRFGDAVLIADTLSARAPGATAQGRLQLSIQSQPGRLEIRIGPLAPGGGRQLLEGAHLPETGAIVERLADQVRIRAGAAGGEMLIVRMDA
jgi:serine/threonine-protein kinase RsbW